LVDFYSLLPGSCYYPLPGRFTLSGLFW